MAVTGAEGVASREHAQRLVVTIGLSFFGKRELTVTIGLIFFEKRELTAIVGAIVHSDRAYRAYIVVAVRE